ncbi:DUF5715 family protein [Granulicella arctica]|uniref:DUF5715 family protein n=1 Tax=Granulicella arctica TaxID=940613 RepID=UPI0021DFBB77|nr:DUF5715 family protein [Granulicella arctica]
MLTRVHTAPRPRDRHPSRNADRPTEHRFRKHESDPKPLRRTKGHARHAVVRDRLIAEPKLVKLIPAPLMIAARPAPETRETGVSHPPDFSDAATAPISSSPSNPAPVVSIIRPTAEKPQLPSIEEAAANPEILPSLYNKRGRLVMPPALKGSREILLHQNEVADRDGLERVQDDDDLESMRRRMMLVAVPINAGMQVDERLPLNRRYCRPWTAQFLTTLARAHYARFHTPLQVNSAVRTVAFQQKLIRTNGNAAPAEGETASPHLTGQAVDLAKRGLSLSEIAWMRGYLLPLVQEGKIDVEEEFQQSCFHVSVYKKYLPYTSSPRRTIATTHRDSPAALAIAIP